jgi:hypothetical protein
MESARPRHCTDLFRAAAMLFGYHSRPFAHAFEALQAALSSFLVYCGHAANAAPFTVPPGKQCLLRHA